MEMLFLLLLLIYCLFESAFRWRFAPCRRQSTYSGFNVAQLFLLINHFYFILKNFKIKITICLHKNFRNIKLKGKNNKTTNKQTNKWNKHHKKNKKKRYPPNPIRFSERFFTYSLAVSILKFYWGSTNCLCYGTMLFIMCHFLVKSIVFFELGQAISFYILFIFRISAMRLFIFKSFFSLNLYTYNLNINKMRLL